MPLNDKRRIELKRQTLEGTDGTGGELRRSVHAHLSSITMRFMLGGVTKVSPLSRILDTPEAWMREKLVCRLWYPFSRLFFQACRQSKRRRNDQRASHAPGGN